MECMAKCGVSVDKGVNAAKCTLCQKYYHRACAGLATGKSVPRGWLCPQCKANTPTNNKSETPVMSQSLVVACGTEQIGIKDILLELKALREDVALMRDEFRSRLAEVDTRIDSINARVDAIECSLAERLVATGNKVLEDAVAALQSTLHERDQDMLACDLQISGIPEAPGESVGHLASTICQKLGVQLDERDVVNCERAGPVRSNADMPRSINIRFARRATRDAVLKAVRVRRTTTTADLGLAGEPRRFYINERLTRHNRQLFKLARERGRQAGWRFTWTREGRVFMRRAEGQPAQRIRSEADLKQFF